MSMRRTFFSGALLAVLAMSLTPAPVWALPQPAPAVQRHSNDVEPSRAAWTATGWYDRGEISGHSYARAAYPAQSIEVSKAADPTTLPEPGGTVTFTVVVTNTGVETVTLTSLLDDPYGDLADDSGNPLIVNSTCATGGTITPDGGVYTCSFQGDVSGDAGAAHTDTVTATAEDEMITVFLRSRTLWAFKHNDAY